MSLNKFKGWEHIDGSSVPKHEIEKSFSIVMQKARAIEKEYISRMLKNRTTRVIKIVAAAVILLIAMPFAAYMYLGNRQSCPMLEYSAPMGEIRQITLSDGSEVVLNAGSTLSYPVEFGRKRIVTLSGEAFFHVSASKTHPFMVRTDDICVTAHGTIFNVCDYPSDPAACAALCSGRISVSRSDGTGQEIRLIENQALTFEKATGATTVGNVETADIISWKDGDLRIRSMKLEQVMNVVERKYNVNIHLTTDRYSNAVLTAKFINNESLAETMDAICKLVPGMEYIIEDNNIYIR